MATADYPDITKYFRTEAFNAPGNLNTLCFWMYEACNKGYGNIWVCTIKHDGKGHSSDAGHMDYARTRLTTLAAIEALTELEKKAFDNGLERVSDSVSKEAYDRVLFQHPEYRLIKHFNYRPEDLIRTQAAIKTLPRIKIKRLDGGQF